MKLISWVSFALSLLFATNVFTQNDQLQYYKSINSAKQHIFEGDYAQAVKYFHDAFSYSDRLYFFDLKNYVIACRKGNLIPEQKFLNTLYKYCDYDTIQLFKQVPEILLKSQDGSIYNFSKATHSGDLNLYYKNELNRIYISSGVEVEFMLDEIQSIGSENSIKFDKSYVDSINFVQFKELVETYGFPHEDMTGIQINDQLNLYTMLEGYLKNYRNNYSVMHYLDSLFSKEKVFPQLYANLFDSRKSNRDFSFSMTPYFIASTVNITDNRLWQPFVYFPDGFIENVDLHRKEIGLDSFKNQQLQVLCSYLCSQLDEGNHRFVQLNPTHKIPIIPYSIVKSSFAMDKSLNYKDYLINSERAIEKCDCDTLKY